MNTRITHIWRVLALIVIWMVAIQNGKSQSYKLDYDFKIYSWFGDGAIVNFYINTYGGGLHKYISGYSLYSGNSYERFYGTYTYSNNEHEIMDGEITTEDPDYSSLRKSIGITGGMTAYVEQLFSDVDCQGYLRYYPIMTDALVQPTDYSFSTDEPITISGKYTAFPYDEDYYWEFSVDNGTTWIPFPGDFQYHKTNTITARELFSESGLNVENYINKYVYIQTGTEYYGHNRERASDAISKQIHYLIIPSSPNITLERTKPLCADSKGHIKCTVDRTLNNNEEWIDLNIYKDGCLSDYQNKDGAENRITINVDNSFIIDGLSGKYDSIKYCVFYYDQTGKKHSTSPRVINNIDLSPPTAMSVSTNTERPLCHGDKGSISLSAKDGTAPYTYTIDGGNQGTLANQSAIATINGLAPGDHVIAVTDNNNCPTSSQTINIADVKAITAFISSHTGITCKGAANGSIRVQVSDGNGGYTYTLYKNGNFCSSGALPSDNTFSALSAGTYRVEISDAKSCSTSWIGSPDHTSISITEPDAVFFTVSPKDITCHDDNDGSITLSATGGNGSYQYIKWKQGESEPSDWIAFTNGATSQITGLSGATYYIKVKDTNGCEAKNTNGVVDTKTVNIFNPSPITIATTTTDVKCYGGSTGSVTITASGGTGILHYNWKDRTEQSRTISGLSSGYYTAIVKDDNGCSTTKPAYVGQPSSLPSVGIQESHNPKTFNGSEGYVILKDPVGGTAPYKYTWKKDDNSYAITTSTSLSNLQYGSYSVAISDANGCNGNTVTVSLSNPVPPIELATQKTDVNCYQGNGGAITITPSRASAFTAPVSYTYQWTKDGILLPALTGNQATNLTKGTYTIKVTDNYGATNSIDVTLIELYSQIIPTIKPTDVTCKGKADGTATVSSISGGAGGYEYSWSNGKSGSSISGLLPGTYTVTVTDKEPCAVTASILVKEPEVLAVSLTPTYPTGYNTTTGNIETTVQGGNGGYTYQWTGTSSTSDNVSNLPAGDYSVKVTDSKQCTASASTLLRQPDPLTVSLVVDKAVSCNGYTNGTLKAMAAGGVTKAGGYKYTWKKVTGTNEATLYSETATASSLSGQGAGTYKILVEDANSNSLLSNNTIVLSEPPALAVASQVVKDVKCYGESTGAISFTVNGGTGSYTYLKNGTELFPNNQTGLPSGNYPVTIHDANNCVLNHTFTIAQPSAPLSVQLQPTHDLSACGSKDGELTATVSGGTAPYAYNWTGSNSTTRTASNLSSGSYSLSVTDYNQCTTGASFRLIDPLKVLLAVKDPIRCYGEMGRIAARAAGGEPASTGLPYTYRWYRILAGNIVQLTQSDSIAVNLTEGSYQVEIEDTKGRTLRSQILRLTQPDQLTVAANVKQVSCKGDGNGAVSLVVNGGNGDYTYLWENGQTDSKREHLQPGTYTVSVSDKKGCLPTPEVLSIGISEPAKLVVSLAKADVTVAGCDGSVTASVGGGTSPYRFSWNGGENVASNKTDKLCPGRYRVTVTDQNMCTVKDSIFLPPPLVATIIVKDTIACHGDRNGTLLAQVKGGVPYKSRQAYDYTWKKLNMAGDYEVLPAETGSSISGLASGWYALNITDSIGAVLKTDSLFFLPEPAILSESTVHSDISCYGMNNGTASINVKGGTLPYNYQWSNNAKTAAVSSLSPGKYHIEVIDRHHCSLRDSATIEEPELLTISLQQKEIIEHNACTGVLTATTNGGMKPYRFEWEGTSTTSNMAAGLCAGSYSVKATDANGCTCNASAVLINPPALRAVISIKDSILCFGDVTGALKAKVEGGIPYKARQPYDYIWKKKSDAGIYEPLDNQNSFTITGLSSGWYALQITDSVGVSLKSDSLFYFPQPTKLSESTIHTDISCYGMNNGIASININGGSLPYNYRWSNNATTPSVSSLPPGKYYIEVSDRHKCTLHDSATVTEPKLLTTTIRKKDLIEHDVCDGILTANTVGGTKPYHFEWTGTGATGNMATGLCGGSYSVKVSDANGCSCSANAALTNPPALRAAISIKDSILCFDNITGTLKVTVEGGIPYKARKPYNYIWKKKSDAGIYEPLDNQNDSTITGLSSGWYAVNVTDSVGVVLKSDSLFYFPQPTKLSESTIHSDISCYGMNNGTASININGGSLPYNYRWSNNANTSSISSLPPGKYYIEVSDRHKCVVRDSVIVTEPKLLTITLRQKDLMEHDVCNGILTANTVGGTKPYLFEWTGTGATGNMATDLCAGSYSVKATDANGCSCSANGVLINPPALRVTISIQDSILCSGGNGVLKLAVSGGIPYKARIPYNYTWKKKNNAGVYEPVDNLTSSTASGLTSGWYAVNVTDSVGISLRSDSLFYLPQPEALIIRVKKDDVLCHGASTGSIKAMVSGGSYPYIYLWNTGVTIDSLKNIAAGNYTVTVTDRHKCVNQYTATINQSDSLIIGFTKVVAPSSETACDGSLQAKVIGGVRPYSYQWIENVSTDSIASNLCFGKNYTLSVTDLYECPATTTKNIKTPVSPFIVSIYVKDSILCHGMNTGVIAARVSGGIPFTTGKPYSYIWSKKDNAGNYRAVTNSNDSIVSGLGRGWYSFSVEDAEKNLLAQPLYISLPEPDTLMIATQHADITCYGFNNGSASVDAIGGLTPYAYLWSNNAATPSVDNLPPGKYKIEVIDSRHCISRDSITIKEPKLLNLILQQKNITEHNVCDGALTATISGGIKPYALEWKGTSPEGSSVTGLCAGAYSVKATDVNGCSSSANSLLVNPPALRVAVSVKDSILCFGNVSGVLKASANGGIPYTSRKPYDYTWKKRNVSGVYETIDNITDSIAYGLPSGWYAVNITDSMGVALKSDSLFFLPQPDMLALSIAPTDISCYGMNNGTASTSVAGGSVPYDYRWSNGATSSSINNLPPEKYSVEVTDRHHCIVKGSLVIKEPKLLNLALQQKKITEHDVCDGALTVNISGGIKPYALEWQGTNPEGNSATGLCAGAYSVKATDSNGCSSSANPLLVNPPALRVALSVKDSILCFGNVMGALKASASGGIPYSSRKPYDYTWKKKGVAGVYETLDNFTDSIATGLSSGWYAVNVTDSMGVALKTDSLFYLPQPDMLTLSIASTDISCFGKNNGTASTSVVGGSIPYNYRWSNGITTSSISNVPPDKYSAEVTDRHHCIVKGSLVIKEPKLLKLALQQQNITEHDVCDGAITASITGGIKPYVLNWTGTHPEGNNATGLCAGIYSVEVADVNGCSDRAGTLLVNPQALQAVVSVRDSVLCNGDKNGALKVSVSGGIPYRKGKPYRYVWKKRDATEIYQVISDFTDSLATGLSSGWYAVNISDSVGVSLHADSLFYLPEPDKLTLRATHSDITCYGNNNGTASVIVTGGVLPYSYSWSNGIRTASIEKLTQGVYAVSVADKHGCISRQTVAIVEPALLTVDLKQQNISEHDVCDGALKTNVTGGRMPYAYSWTGVSAPTASVNALCAGSYGVKVTDASGCVATNSSVLKNPPALRMQLLVQDSVQCHGNANGTLKASAKGGIPRTTGRPYSYTWKRKNGSGLFEVMPGYNDSIATGLTTGVYACNITDANGISLHQNSVIILPEPDFLQLAIRKTNIGCSGNDEGNATAIVSGGTVPYAYAWNTGDKTATIDHLAAGAYIARVTDRHGCVAAQQTIISKASPLYMSFYKSNPVCYQDCNGSIIATVSGGTTPYLYRWTGTTATGANASALCAGDYSLSVTDAAGCLVQKGESLTNPAQLPLNLGSDRFICNGQTIRYNIEIAGLSGITYNWIGPEGFVSSKAVVDITRAGIYKASVTDSKGCRNSAMVTLTPSETIVDNEFVLPTQAFVNEKIVVVNTTHPVPDSIQWVLPSGAQISTMGQAYVEFMVPDTGAYVIRMISYKGECNAQQDKWLLVSDRSQLNSIGTTKTPFIRSFAVLPNPNHGNFEVKIDLQDKADVQLKLINILSNRVVSQIRKSGDSSYEVPINVSLPPGTYLMLLETPKGSTTAKVIIF